MQALCNLEFHDYDIINQQISSKVSNRISPEAHIYRMLTTYLHAGS